jgi:hypothetical protein
MADVKTKCFRVEWRQPDGLHRQAWAITDSVSKIEKKIQEQRGEVVEIHLCGDALEIAQNKGNDDA